MMKFLTAELNPRWNCHTLSCCRALWEGRAECKSVSVTPKHQHLGRCHTDGLFCKFTSLVEALELSQYLIFFEWCTVTFEWYTDFNDTQRFCLSKLPSTSILVVGYITSKINPYEWLCNTFEILGYAFASKLEVVGKLINIHEFRETSNFWELWCMQVTVTNEYQLSCMEKLCLKSVVVWKFVWRHSFSIEDGRFSDYFFFFFFTYRLN